MHPRLAPALLLIAACALTASTSAACGGSGGMGADGPVIRGVATDADVAAAQVSGTLTRAGDCLTLADAVVVWPADATWDREAASVSYDDRTFAVGAAVQLAGGFYETEEAWTSVVDDAATSSVRACLDTTGLTTVAIVG